MAKTIFYSLAALVRKILFCHSKIKFISSRHHVISSIYSLKWVGWGWVLIWVWLEGGGGGRLFKAGHLLTFSAFRMGAYSRCALIRGWALIRINTVRVRFAGFSCNIYITEQSKFEITYFKKKTNQRKRFCSRKFKLAVYCPMICFKFSRKIRKLFHKNERFGAILNLHVEWSPLTWLNWLSSFLMKVYHREAKFGV